MSGSEHPFSDFHNHLVPGVDDGSRTVEEALEGVERLRAAGIGRIVTTPHFRGSLTRDPEAFEVRLGELDAGWRQVFEVAGEHAPGFEMRRGAEVLLDDPAVILDDERIRLGGTHFVLVEWPGFRVPPRSTEVLARIVEEGYRPVVAHPERYGGAEAVPGTMYQWREVGAFLQMNAGSLVGRYGREAQRRAEELLELGLVEYLCTDYHARRGYDLYFEPALERFRRAGAEEVFMHLAAVNTGRLLDGLDPYPIGPVEVREGLWGKVRSFFDTGEGS